MPYLLRRESSARKCLKKIASAESDIAGKNILCNVPECYVEHFSSLAESTLPLIRREIGKVYVEHFGSLMIAFSRAYFVSMRGTCADADRRLRR